MCNPSVSPEGKEMETSDKTKDYHTQKQPSTKVHWNLYP